MSADIGSSGHWSLRLLLLLMT